jgi:hypothetical protein
MQLAVGYIVLFGAFVECGHMEHLNFFFSFFKFMSYVCRVWSYGGSFFQIRDMDFNKCICCAFVECSNMELVSSSFQN